MRRQYYVNDELHTRIEIRYENLDEYVAGAPLIRPPLEAYGYRLEDHRYDTEDNIVNFLASLTLFVTILALLYFATIGIIATIKGVV